MTQPAPRGAALHCLSWAPGETSSSLQVWRLSVSLPVSSRRPGCLVAGSEAAGLVLTVSGSRAVTTREEETGKVVWEEVVESVIQNIWVGDSVVVVIPPDFKQGNTVACIHI